MTTIDLKQRLSKKPILVAPGIADTLSAVIAQYAGFEAVFLSGSALAYTHLGRPDIGLLSLGEVTAITSRIAERIDIPILVDADSGFGNVYHVHRSVRALERAGAGGIQIEDQVNDQHPDDIGRRPVIPLPDMLAKLRAALDARHSETTLISARSDAVFSEGVTAALKRAVAYVDVGADIVFVEGLVDTAARRQLVNLVGGRAAILFNMALPTGDTAPDAGTLQAEGFSIALSPAVVVNAVANACEEALAALANEIPGSRPDKRVTGTRSARVIDAIRGEAFISNYRKWSTQNDQ